MSGRRCKQYPGELFSLWMTQWVGNPAVRCHSLFRVQTTATHEFLTARVKPFVRHYTHTYTQQLIGPVSYVTLRPIHTADATQLSSWVASAVCIEFATSWRQSRRVSTSLNNLPTTKLSCVVSAVWTHQSSVVTQFPIFCASHIWLQNCKLGHDSRRARTHRRHNSTRQLSRVGVGGVYWVLRNWVSMFGLLLGPYANLCMLKVVFYLFVRNFCTLW